MATTQQQLPTERYHLAGVLEDLKMLFMLSEENWLVKARRTSLPEPEVLSVSILSFEY